MRRLDEGKARDRSRPLRAVVNAEERAQIEQRAKGARLTISAYLRACALGIRVRSSALEHEQVMLLSRVNADQGRLGGLLKLWLTDRPGTGATIREVRQLLAQIEAVQAQLAEASSRL